MSSRIFHDDAANHIAGFVEFAHSENAKEIFGACAPAVEILQSKAILLG